MVSFAAYAAAVPVSLIVAIGLIRRLRARKWGRCTSTSNLRGKTYLITGANCGIGYETAKALVKRNARVIFACRDVNKAKKAIADIRKEHPIGGEMIPMHLDLSSMDSIESFVELVKAGFPKIDVLINNAGVAVPLKMDMKTREGFEIHLGVNHLGHFKLTNLLLESLRKATPSRVVIVASTLFAKGNLDFDDLNLTKQIKLAKAGKTSSRNNMGYNNSKLMNVYFGRALADKWKQYGIDVYTCCPGFTYTNLFRYSFRWYHYILMAPILLFYMRSAEEGSQTIQHCATEYTIEGKTGGFYRDCEIYDTKYKFDRMVENKLWDVSEQMIKARKPL